MATDTLGGVVPYVAYIAFTSTGLALLGPSAALADTIAIEVSDPAQFQATLQQAIDQASPGDILLLPEGQYQANVIEISTPGITIRSVNPDNPTHLHSFEQPLGPGELPSFDFGRGLFLYSGVDDDVEGVSIEYVRGSDHMYFLEVAPNLDFTAPFPFPRTDGSITGVKVEGCEISNNVNGVWIQGDIRDVEIRHNHIERTDRSILVRGNLGDFAERIGAHIHHNTIVSGKTSPAERVHPIHSGMVLWGTTGMNVHDNTIHGFNIDQRYPPNAISPGFGILVIDFHTTGPEDEEWGTIRRNTLTDNGVGVVFNTNRRTGPGTVHDNEISAANGVGIVGILGAYGTNNLVFSGNQFSGQDTDVVLDPGTYDNTVIVDADTTYLVHDCDSDGTCPAGYDANRVVHAGRR